MECADALDRLSNRDLAWVGHRLWAIRGLPRRCGASLPDLPRWKRHSPSVDPEIRSSDFAAGWKQGYLDITSGGNGEAPLVPPEKYWGDRFRTANGHARINQWYAGYDTGAIAAEQDGAFQFAHIPVATGGPVAPPSIWNPGGHAPAWPEEIQPAQEEIQGTPVTSSSQPQSFAAAPPAASAAPQAVAASPQPALPPTDKVEEQSTKVATTPVYVAKLKHLAAAPPAASAVPQAVAASPQPALPPTDKAEEQSTKVATTPANVAKPKHLAAAPSVRRAELPVEAAPPQPVVLPTDKAEEQSTKIATMPVYVAKLKHLAAAPPVRLAEPPVEAALPQPAVPPTEKGEEQSAKVATTPVNVAKAKHVAAAPSVRLAEPLVETAPAVDNGKKQSAEMATKRRKAAAPNRLAVAAPPDSAPSNAAPQPDEAKPSRLTMITPIGIAEEPMASATNKVAAAPNRRIASRPTIAVKPRQSGSGARSTRVSSQPCPKPIVRGRLRRRRHRRRRSFTCRDGLRGSPSCRPVCPGSFRSDFPDRCRSTQNRCR